jgi:NhaP-type Na+/H+ or K+/H+ antiporter
MSNLNQRLSIAAVAVLEALPNQLGFSGPSAVALAGAIENMAHEVEQLLQAVWGFGDLDPS